MLGLVNIRNVRPSGDTYQKLQSYIPDIQFTQGSNILGGSVEWGIKMSSYKKVVTGNSNFIGYEEIDREFLKIDRIPTLDWSSLQLSNELLQSHSGPIVSILGGVLTLANIRNLNNAALKKNGVNLAKSLEENVKKIDGEFFAFSGFKVFFKPKFGQVSFDLYKSYCAVQDRTEDKKSMLNGEFFWENGFDGNLFKICSTLNINPEDWTLGDLGYMPADLCFDLGWSIRR